MSTTLLDLCLIWSLFVLIWHTHIRGFIYYSIRRLIFAETAEDDGGIQLYVHIAYACMSYCTVMKRTYSNPVMAKESERSR